MSKTLVTCFKFAKFDQSFLLTPFMWYLLHVAMLLTTNWEQCEVQGHSTKSRVTKTR